MQQLSSLELFPKYFPKAKRAKSCGAVAAAAVVVVLVSKRKTCFSRLLGEQTKINIAPRKRNEVGGGVGAMGQGRSQ